jgi:hypothetical protein
MFFEVNETLGAVIPLCRREQLQDEFPHLDIDNARVLRHEDDNYNCFAWALGFTDRWLNANNYFGTRSKAAFVRAFEAAGWKKTKRPSGEQVAIYKRGRDVTHVARRTKVDGRYVWTSKLGSNELITHDSPASLEGGYYGDVVQILSRG